jgi:hypothetical protein
LAEPNKGRSPGKKENNKRSKRFYALALACAAILVAGIVVFIVKMSNREEQIDQSGYSIGYVIKALPEEGCLDVGINIDIFELSQDRTVMLYKGQMTDDALEYTVCTDGSGRELPFADTPDLVSIGPVDDDCKTIRFEYKALIGDASPGYDPYEIPYVQGCLFDDLIVFSGEYALLIPFLDPASFDSMEKYVRGVSFEFIVPEGLDPIIPFQAPIDGKLSFSIDKPDWDFFNAISKSAFCFGHFERYDYNRLIEGATVFIDEQAKYELSQYSLDALVSFLDSNRVAFGEPLGDVPIVLLRNHPADGSVITGGAGSACSAVSINLRIAEDFRALSNMVFHTFFDSKIKPRNLRYNYYAWIYRGMAEYYVGKSANNLPGYIVDEYSIGGPMHPAALYLKYLYFSLKEPGFLALGPANELSGMYIAQEEFYMSVKVPIIIDAINYSIGERTGEEDGFLKTLVRNGKSSEPLDVEKLLKEVCDADFDVIKDYLSGKALVPNYNYYDINKNNYGGDMSLEGIMYMLDMDEQKNAYFFGQENVNYPYVPLILLNEDAFMQEVAKRGISYNSGLIQDEVEKFSSILHRLLLQYAMWASVSGIDDVTQPNVYRVLTQPENMEKWYALCEQIGVEYEVEG